MYKHSISALLALGLLFPSGQGRAMKIFGKNIGKNIKITHHNRERGTLPPEIYEKTNWGHGEKGFEAPNHEGTHTTSTSNSSNLPVVDDGLSYSKFNVRGNKREKVGRSSFILKNDKQGGLHLNVANLLDRAMLYQYAKQSDWKKRPLSTVALPMSGDTVLLVSVRGHQKKLLGDELLIWGLASSDAIKKNPENVSVIPLDSKKEEKDKDLASKEHFRRETAKMFALKTFTDSPKSFLAGFDPDLTAKKVEVTFFKHDQPLRNLPKQPELPMPGLSNLSK